MQPQDKNFTDLDFDLQRLAAVDWSTFVSVVGEDAITSAKICILKSRGKSLNQISMRLNITRRKAEVNCKVCPNIPKETVT